MDIARSDCSQNDHLRQALAIAIVQQKRKQKQELQQLHWKVARVEAELQQERQASTDLRRATAVLAVQQQQQKGTSGKKTSRNDDDVILQHWLPPLAAEDGATDADVLSTSALINLLPLQQQIAAASRHTPSAAVRDVLSGKAQALSSMLLANVRMLRVLRLGGAHAGASLRPRDAAGAPSAPATAQSGSMAGELEGQQVMEAAGPAAEISEFVAGTLLHTPVSSLSHTYITESAAALAACLAAVNSSSTSSSGGGCDRDSDGRMALHGQHAMATKRTGQQDTARQSVPAASGSREELHQGAKVTEVVGQLISRLMEAAMPTAPRVTSSTSGDDSPAVNSAPADSAPAALQLTAPAAAVPSAIGPEVVAQQARCMLRALALLPPAGAALLRGAALHLQRACEALVEAQQVLLLAGGQDGGAGSGRGGGPQTDGGGGVMAQQTMAAMTSSAAVFEASHELLELWAVRGFGCSDCHGLSLVPTPTNLQIQDRQPAPGFRV